MHLDMHLCCQRTMLLFVLGLGCILPSYATTSPPSRSQYRLLHRLYSLATPGAEEGLFTPRAYLEIDAIASRVALAPSPEFDTSTLSEFMDSNTLLEDPNALYQVAIERLPLPTEDGINSGSSEAALDISSIRACHLPFATSSHIVLHLSSRTAVTPFSVDFFVSPSPHSGACPSRKALRERLLSLSSSNSIPAALSLSNITVELRKPDVPPLPALRTPPPLTPDGAPVQSLPEKSFIQKYWIYIAVGLLALMFAPGPPEDGAGEGGNSGR